jgi:hypothetical protein
MYSSETGSLVVNLLVLDVDGIVQSRDLGSDETNLFLVEI